MLTASGLTVEFAGVRPLDAIECRFEAPVCGLIGPNGAGKTTFLNAVSGFVKPVAGTLTWKGTELTRMRPHQRARLGIRRVFQRDQLIEGASVADNLRIGCEHVPGERGASPEEILGLLGLEELAAEPVVHLGGYERRLVEIGRTVAGSPQLLLLDEPGAGLDERETLRLGEVVRSLVARFEAMALVVDHDMNLVRGICETVTVLDFGEVIASGEAAATLEDRRVRAAYLGTEEL